jgi:hypothetical protein
MGKKMTGKKNGQCFFTQSFFCLKTADFWNTTRTVRSPGFPGLALQRAVEIKTPICSSCKKLPTARN